MSNSQFYLETQVQLNEGLTVSEQMQVNMSWYIILLMQRNKHNSFASVVLSTTE